MWTCPNCGRSFKHANQSHSCNSVNPDAMRAGWTLEQNAILEQLLVALSKIGQFETSAVKSALYLKVESTFMAIKPKGNGLVIEFYLAHMTDEVPIVKRLQTSKHRIAHSVELEGTHSISLTLLKLLKESYTLVTSKNHHRNAQSSVEMKDQAHQ